MSTNVNLTVLASSPWKNDPTQQLVTFQDVGPILQVIPFQPLENKRYRSGPPKTYWVDVPSAQRGVLIPSGSAVFAVSVDRGYARLAYTIPAPVQAPSTSAPIASPAEAASSLPQIEAISAGVSRLGVSVKVEPVAVKAEPSDYRPPYESSQPIKEPETVEIRLARLEKEVEILKELLRGFAMGSMSALKALEQ